MSFRRQLIFSIGLLVLVPALLAAAAVTWVVNSNERAKTDARLASAVRVGTVLVGERTRRSERRASDLEEDIRFRRALESGDRATIAAELPAALDRGDLLAARVELADGTTITSGPQDAIGISRVATEDNAGRPIRVTFGYSGPTELVSEVQRITGIPLQVVGPGGRIITASPQFPEGNAVDTTTDPPSTRGRWRTRTEVLPAVRGEQLTAVAAAAPARGDATTGWQFVAGLLVAITSIGGALAWSLLVAVRRRISGFVHAAERVGAGDFDAAEAIPVTGGDEFSRLGRAFVDMSEQLDRRLQQLEQERERVRVSLDRLGQAFAANLDRDQLVTLVVDAAVAGTNAAAGRALLPTGTTSAFEEHGATGDVPGLATALAAAEQRCLQTGSPVVLAHDGLHAIAEPLQIQRGARTGAIAVARNTPFDADERSMLRYLTRQAEVSLHNVGRHEDVARESITDDLTGLANRRRFDDVLDAAAARATNDAPVALVMIDLDHFKSINDTHGHLFGDTVLRAVGHLIHESARDRDLPARYGGEELAVILAKGDPDAAAAYAERLRRDIAALQLGDDTTGPVSVTASIGVAALPSVGSDAAALVRAADEALYRAKQGGRNRVEVATPAQPAEGKVR